MSILQYNSTTGTSSVVNLTIGKNGEILNPKSSYDPDDATKSRLNDVIQDFILGDMTMRTPRREWNDMSTLDRMTLDQMAFNTYQPNDGDSSPGDEVNSWRSNAVRPVVRNKVISIAAHATARLIFPKVFAWDIDSDEQRDAAMVMTNLMEWAADQSGYSMTSLYSTISALINPASIVYTEYSETYRTVKTTKKEGGGYNTKEILDEELSGFQDTVIPVDELYIENFYETDIQKQGFLIWRRVIPYSLASAKYGHLDSFQYVSPGVQLVYNDANQSFYQVYDSQLRQYDVEEIIYWNRNKDLKITTVNGVMLCDADNPNPRNDKRYPMMKFGYELLGEGNCFYYKSLVFKMGPDAKIINTLYPMIIDGTYLNIMPPMMVTGSDIIGSDVIVPGAVTTITDEGASITPINSATNLRQGFDTLTKVEESVDESSQTPMSQGQQSTKTNTTAYEISRLEQNSATVLGLFLQMRTQFVKDYGQLRMSDILQFMTIADVENLEEGNPKLVYKTFLLHDKPSDGTNKTMKIMFDNTLPTEPIDTSEDEDMSFDILEQEGGLESKVELYKVNPELFRNLKFSLRISPDIINPMSEDLERAFLLEEYDRAIQNPLLDQNEVTKDFLLGAYPRSKKDPGKYFSKALGMAPAGEGRPPVQGGQPGGALKALTGGGTPSPTVPTPGAS